MIETECPAFSIGFDRETQLMSISLRGFWVADDQLAYERELRRCLSLLPANGCRVGQQRMLVDITDHSVQSASALEFFARITSDRVISGRKSALIVSSALVKMQATRIAPRYRIFQDRDEASRWLISEDD